MKQFWLVVSVVMIAVIITVLFVPGVRERIEGRVLTWLVGLAG